MKFSYRKLDAVPSPAFPRRKFYLRPIIPISIVNKNKAIRYEALIDSGSDYNVFPAELCSYLGIDIKSGKQNPAKGVSGPAINIYFHKLILSVAGIEYKAEVGFTENMNQPTGLLGQIGFFDKFSVKFESNEVEITKI